MRAKISCCTHLLTLGEHALYHCYSCGSTYVLSCMSAGRDTLHDALAPVAPVQNPNLLAAVRKLDAAAVTLAHTTNELATYLEKHQ